MFGFRKVKRGNGSRLDLVADLWVPIVPVTVRDATMPQQCLSLPLRFRQFPPVMSVYPSFDQPSGKLYIGSEKHDIVEKICSSHYYNHAVCNKRVILVH